MSVSIVRQGTREPSYKCRVSSRDQANFKYKGRLGTAIKCLRRRFELLLLDRIGTLNFSEAALSELFKAFGPEIFAGIKEAGEEESRVVRKLFQ